MNKIIFLILFLTIAAKAEVSVYFGFDLGTPSIELCDEFFEVMDFARNSVEKRGYTIEDPIGSCSTQQNGFYRVGAIYRAPSETIAQKFIYDLNGIEYRSGAGTLRFNAIKISSINIIYSLYRYNRKNQNEENIIIENFGEKSFSSYAEEDGFWSAGLKDRESFKEFIKENFPERSAVIAELIAASHEAHRFVIEAEETLQFANGANLKFRYSIKRLDHGPRSSGLTPLFKTISQICSRRSICSKALQGSFATEVAPWFACPITS